MNGEHKLCCVDSRITQIQRHCCDCDVTIGFHDHTVSVAIIVLNGIATGQPEHAAFADKGHRGSLNSGRINTGVAVLRCSSIDIHGHFHILNIILAKGEDALCFILSYG